MSTTNATDAIQANAHSSSTATFTTALWINAVVFGLEILAFTLLRRQFKAIYEPRTYIPDKDKRSAPLSSRLLAWPLEIYKADYRAIKQQNGMDAYFYVRFLRMMVKILVPIWLISWAVLLPITSVNMVDGKSGLDRFTFGNIGPTQQTRYAAHIILLYGFTFWIWYNIKKEMRHFVTARQRHLVDPVHSASAQANTVLVTGVPTKYLSERAITRLFSHLPGGVRKVWLNRDLKELPDFYNRRLKACDKLESAETSLLNTAVKLRNKRLKAEAKAQRKGQGSPTSSSPSGDPLSPDLKSADREKALSLAEQLVPANKRPTHRLPVGPIPFSLPLIGKKVDSITWAREEIEVTTVGLEKGRTILRREEEGQIKAKGGKVGGFAGLVGGVVPLDRLDATNIRIGKHGLRHQNESDVEWAIDPDTASSIGPATRSAAQPKASTSTEIDAEKDAEKGSEVKLASENEETYPPLNSAFVLFNQQIAAHLAAQALAHHEPYRMAEKYSEVAPADVIWGNLGLNPYEMKVRLAISYAVTVGLIIVWAIPVAFIGAVSNVANLCATYHWLAWLCNLPKTVVGILQGVLPPVLLAVLMMVLPIFLRFLAQFEGIPRKTGLELSLMTRYFAFQVVHSFLVVTLSSGIIAALPGLVKNPTSIPALLASSLPQASNFFLTYTVLQGLSGAAAGFLQIVPLVIYYVKLFLLGSTPRSVYNIKYTLRNIQWGTLFPATTLVAVITLAYSIISPIINGLAVLTFFLFYQMWKYLFLYQLEQPTFGDTGGLFFPKAIQHVFVGLYIQLICLAALFFLARDENKKASAVPEGALTIVLIIFTAFFHMIINNSYGPLLHALPLSLADKSYGMPRHSAEGEEQPLIGQADDGFGGEEGKEKAAEAEVKDAHAREDGEQSDAESGDSHVAKKQVTGKQPVRGEDGAEYGASVPMEGKRNDEPTDFYHPASVEPLRVIWLPRDSLGLAEQEVRENQKLGIEASFEHAHMDEKGHVDIDGHPPGMLQNEEDEEED